jgi:hypothetical protein
MPSLRDLQLDFLAQALDGDRGVSTSWLTTHRLDLATGIDIYRNNASVGFRKALQASFPVLVKLAGEDWFHVVAALYQATHPSRSGDLNEVGDRFAEFLASHLEGDPERYGKTFGYFPDVARLEWAYQEALNDTAVDIPDIASLQQGLASVDDSFRFVLNPTLRLCSSSFPIYEIWSWNREETETVPDLAGGCSQVLVLKAGRQTHVRSISADALTLLQALMSGAAFVEAIENLTIDLPPALAELIQVHAIVGVTPLTGDVYVN